MGLSNLRIYNTYPFNPGTEVDPVDLFIGNGSQTTFTLTYKSGTRLGATIQFDAFQYYLYNSGYTKSGNTFTLSSAPPAGSQGIAPGVNPLLFTAFDTDNVPGVTTPRVSQVPFYIADINTISTYKYLEYPGTTGITLAFTDLATAVGATTSWTQLACSTDGQLPGTYQSAGTSLSTAGLYAFGLLSASSTAGTNVNLFTPSASAFYKNDFIMINPGTITAETARINATSIALNRLTVDGTNYTHYADEQVYTCGRLFYAKLTVPDNAVGGVATVLYDMGLRIQATLESRL